MTSLEGEGHRVREGRAVPRRRGRQVAVLAAPREARLDVAGARGPEVGREVAVSALRGRVLVLVRVLAAVAGGAVEPGVRREEREARAVVGAEHLALVRPGGGRVAGLALEAHLAAVRVLVAVGAGRAHPVEHEGAVAAPAGGLRVGGLQDEARLVVAEGGGLVDRDPPLRVVALRAIELKVAVWLVAGWSGRAGPAPAPARGRRRGQRGPAVSWAISVRGRAARAVAAAARGGKRLVADERRRRFASPGGGRPSRRPGRARRPGARRRHGRGRTSRPSGSPWCGSARRRRSCPRARTVPGGDRGGTPRRSAPRRRSGAEPAGPPSARRWQGAQAHASVAPRERVARLGVVEGHLAPGVHAGDRTRTRPSRRSAPPRPGAGPCGSRRTGWTRSGAGRSGSPARDTPGRWHWSQATARCPPASG